MDFSREPENEVGQYSGPYERWVFAKELGWSFAFPAVRLRYASHFAAILEGSADLEAMEEAEVRLPPLWQPQDSKENERPSVTPFVFKDDSVGTAGPDIQLAKRLASIGSTNKLTPRFRVNMPMSADSWVAAYQPEAAMEGWIPPARKPKAIIGVIDDGLPFANRAFLGSEGRTRFSHLWLQAGRAQERDAVPFGREISNAEIDGWRRKHGPDERLIYRRSGAIDPNLAEIGWVLEQRSTHGAHVAGLAAGNDRALVAEPLPDEVLIIGVQLPNTIAWDTSGFGKEMYMLSALHYVFHRARAIALHYANDPEVPEELPLVVNFSYGWNASRHDGQSEIEAAIEELLTARKRWQEASAVVMPMGNNFSQAMHAQLTADDLRIGLRRIGWRLLPDDRTSSYLEIWLPPEFEPYGWQVQVSLPGQKSPAVALEIESDPEERGPGDSRGFEELKIDGKIIAQISVDKNRGTRWRVLLALIPTAYVRSEDRRAPFGLWTISILPNSRWPLPEHEKIDFWVQRDDDPQVMGSGGRQSRLEEIDGSVAAESDRDDIALDVVRGFGCYNGIASSESTTRVAGIVDSTREASSYSGAGGLKRTGRSPEPWSVLPTCAAISDQSELLPGVMSNGVVSGSFARLVGTSTAAAAASRTMVRNAAAGRGLMDGIELLKPLREGRPNTRLAKDNAILKAARVGVGHFLTVSRFR